MILMQCLFCGTMVENPKVMNYMTERCTPCELSHREMASRAIDTYLDQKAEEQYDAQQLKTDTPAR